jgi:hypothetical protein
MGPDHSQLEIYEESKHGVLFQAQRKLLNLDAVPTNLTTRDMFVPTCATCHMSGLNGMNVTHDPSERLSYRLFAEVSEKRPNYARAQANMKDICLACHTKPVVDQVYLEAERVVAKTNEKVLAAKGIVDALRKDGLLAKPFQEPIDFAYFDLWHYYGRTSKHGAFMGGRSAFWWFPCSCGSTTCSLCCAHPSCSSRSSLVSSDSIITPRQTCTGRLQECLITLSTARPHWLPLSHLLFVA